MSGDYSRNRFNPRADIASVWMQQGRVQLDSDWNEGMAALDRRLRAESVDTLGVHPKSGIAGVAVVSPQTPDAFKIEAAGDSISIGRGRMYVDGLLAENHGSGTEEFDAVLSELRGTTALNYDEQPYLPAPLTLPNGGPYLAYLEVWRRELTYLQHPEMVENAVGVDTTTRQQTVWQVRFLSNIDSAECTTPDDQFPAWQALTQPSASRMSIKAEGVPPELDPCELPPTGGYRGLENQLYRIEIHDGGIVGQATFKWSRDNGSVASNVVEIISPTQMKLASLGRDSVLRFNTGDWVEILDDHRELSGENGDPALRRGEMRKITNIVNRTINFTDPLPDDLIPGGGDTLTARHTRIRRWDSNGLISVSAADVWVELENGIQVEFKLDPNGSEFRCGDYWLSAARTADTSIEAFEYKPPLGIHRHYARLAIINFLEGESHKIQSDCRIHWPSDCGDCCTITVTPGKDIQAAIDSLPAYGGCVCLKSGVHIINQPIQILSDNITLKGESYGGVYVYANSVMSTLLLIKGGNVSINNINFYKDFVSESGTILISVEQSSEYPHIEGCLLFNDGDTSKVIGINLMCTGSRIINNLIIDCGVGILIDDPVTLFIPKNSIISKNTIIVLGFTNIGVGDTGIISRSRSTSLPLYIINNLIAGYQIAISLLGRNVFSPLIASVLVSGNFIKCVSSEPDGFPKQLFDPLEETNYLNLNTYFNAYIYAIDVRVSHCIVSNNTIILAQNFLGGIRTSTSNININSNKIYDYYLFPPHKRIPQPVGIFCYSVEMITDNIVINNNQFRGTLCGIVMERVVKGMITDNFLDDYNENLYLKNIGVVLYNCHECSLQNNKFQFVNWALVSQKGIRTRVVGNSIIDNAKIGILVRDLSNLEINNNQLTSCNFQGILSNVSNGDLSLIGNRIINCGRETSGSDPHIIWSALSYLSSGNVHIENCIVMSNDKISNESSVTGGIFGRSSNLQMINNIVDYRNSSYKHFTALYSFPWTGASSTFLVNNNYFGAPSSTSFSPLVNISLSYNLNDNTKLTFSNNICENKFNPGILVNLSGTYLILIGNNIEGLSDGISLSLNECIKTTLMGNIVSGKYQCIEANTIPKTVLEFNVGSGVI